MKHGYRFNASATGLTGHITSPFDHVIESQAPSALSSIGGYSGAREPGFRFKEIVSFRAAYTQVIGSYSEETASWDTVLTSTVEGLDILGVLQAERVVARIATRHYRDPKFGPDAIRPVGSQIDGLFIGGVETAIVWNKDLICNLDTYQKITDSYEHPSSSFRARYDSAHYIGETEQLEEHHRPFFPWSDREKRGEIPNKGGVIATSLVESVSAPRGCLDSRAHVIHVPQFGTIVLAQYLPSQWGATIDMIQVHLGCAANGTVAAGGGATSGQPMPPPHGN
jgi:hypothetical protein